MLVMNATSHILKMSLISTNQFRIIMQVVARLRASSRSTADADLVNYVIQPGRTPATI